VRQLRHDDQRRAEARLQGLPARLPDGLIRVEPLAHFPIERDLVTVIDDFMAKLARVRPYLIPKDVKAIEEGEYRQTPAELKRFKQYSMCINCMLCYAACPEYALIPKYIGPAAIALAHRWNQDSRDGGREARQEEIAATEGAWECSFVGRLLGGVPRARRPGGRDPAGEDQEHGGLVPST
jgi:fumarate reductase iron-sulfur subunit